MWSHYADDHKGACLKFSLPMIEQAWDKKENGSFVKKVKYVDERQEYTHPDDIKEAVEKIFIPKSKIWDYEKEWRVIDNVSANPDIEDLTEKYNDITGMIVGCTLGMNVDPKQIECFQKLFKKLCKNLPNFDLKQARMHDTEYALVYDKI